MKLIRIFALGTLFVAALYLPFFWYLGLRGQIRRREKLAWAFAHWWGRALIWATGSRVQVSGTENIPPGPVVVMGNHQSLFDIMLVLGYIDKPLAFIAKKELAKYPVFSSWMNYLGCLFLDREDIRQAVMVFQQAVEQVKSGWSMVIFPEGTRSCSVALAPLKNGSMKLPLRGQVPIVPISINGTYKAYEGNGYRIGSADISLAIAKPIFPEEFAGLGTKEIADLVRKKIEQGLPH